MLPLFLLALAPVQAQAQAPQPLPVVEAKDLPAARGPLAPNWPDPAGPARDLTSQARRTSRKSTTLPALALPADSVRIKDAVPDISGWRAYRAEVPPGGTIQVQVVEGRRAWYRVQAVNRWGRLEEGMLQNLIWKGEPQASYKNPSATETKEVWFVVDTLDALMMGEKFEVEVRRK